MKQTQKTRVVSGRRRGGSVLALEKKGSGSHSGEWRRALWRERESDVSHLHLGRSGTCRQRARENTGTVAKQNQLPKASGPIARYIECAGRAPRISREY